MGLDMRLSRHTYGLNLGGNAKVTATVTWQDVKGNEHTKTYKFKGVLYVSESVMQWRNANQIHKWFVDNVQNGDDGCRQYWVTDIKLMELRDLCKVILDDHDLAPKLLPTYEGFLFGSQEYDDDYFEDIQYTYDNICGLDFTGCEYYYGSSY